MSPRPRPSRRADARALLGVAAAAIDRDRPLMAHLIVTRRCNLSCGYCTEYDKVSPPVSRATLTARIDQLARLRVVFVTLTGGEPLLHPDLPAVIAHVRARGMTPVMNTNGYLLTAAWIQRLGEAGLYAMQISVDNVTPNATTMKSLKTLLPKLRLLSAHASFRVRVNTVLGSGPPEEALEVARTALALGFDAKCSLVRNPDGSLAAQDARARAVYDQIRRLGRRAPSYLSEDFQLPLLDDGQLAWKCRAGARVFHVCEDGLVHLCAPKWGAGAVPLADYTVDDIRRAFDAPKPCATTCPVAYAHQASRADAWRPQAGPPLAALTRDRRYLPVVA